MVHSSSVLWRHVHVVLQIDFTMEENQKGIVQHVGSLASLEVFELQRTAKNYHNNKAHPPNLLGVQSTALRLWLWASTMERIRLGRGPYLVLKRNVLES